MGTRSSQTITNRNSLARKIILGLIATIATAVIGSAGVVAAQSPDNNNSSDTPSFVSFCKTHYQQLGFSNVGQCVSHHNDHGHGYGGGGGDNDNDGDNHGNHHHHFHFHFHDFFGGWWHHVEHQF